MDQSRGDSTEKRGQVTPSSSYYHPQLICEEKPLRIRVDAKTGVPQVSDFLNAKNLKQLDDRKTCEEEDRFSRITGSVHSLSTRRRDETKEEKQARKAMVKEMRRERRIERKMNQTAFKDEKKKQLKEASNARPGVTRLA